MAVTLVSGQFTAGTSNFGSTSVSSTFAAPAGTGILVASVKWVIVSPAADATTTSITDDKSNPYNTGAGSWIPLTDATRAGTIYSFIHEQLFYIITPITGVNTITANFSASVSGFISIWELTTGVFDQQASATGTTVTAATYSVGSITTATNGSYAIAGTTTEDGLGADQITQGSGWTLGMHVGGGSADLADEYQEQTTAGALSGDFAVSVAINFWAGGIVTFKPAGGGGGGPAVIVIRNQIAVPGPRRTQIIQM